jgi:cell division FtsZ-interacting protein ZapD
MNDETPLERLEALSTEVEELATRVALRAKAFGAEVGASNRVALVRQRLKIAADELDAYPASFGDITDE